MYKKFLVLMMISSFSLVACKNESTASYSLSEKDCTINWSLCTIFPDLEFELSESEPIKIAILDSGINDELTILKNRVTDSYNTLTNSTDTEDLFGHGTMVAGVIAAEKNEGTVMGVNPSVDLYDVQVLNDKGGGQVSDVVEGIEWSVKKGVDIINLSFGFSKDEPELKDAINLALENNIIVVASAGNTLGLSTDYPAKYDGVISVSAIDSELNKYIFAGAGKIDFVAPGVDVPVYNHLGKVEKQSGTSIATAYTSGLVSILLQNKKNKRNIDVELKQTAKELGSAQKYGKGIIQLSK